jgi:hypothetical protein
MTESEEKWAAVGGGFEVSNRGNTRFEGINKEPYNLKYKMLNIDGQLKYIHHLVAEHFIGPRPEKHIVDHIDREKYNNDVSNLRYITQQKNCCNKASYRTDVEEEDPVERRRILGAMNAKKRYNDRPDVREQKKAYYQANKAKLQAYGKANYAAKKAEAV